MHKKTRIINIIGNDSRKALVAQSLSYYIENSIILDFNHGSREVECALNVENEVVYDILDVLMGNCKIEQATITNEDGISVISSSYKEKCIIKAADLIHLVKQLENYSAIILVNGINIEDADTILFEKIIDPDVNSYLILESKDRMNKEEHRKYFFLGQLDDIYENKLMNGEHIDSDDMNSIVINFIHKTRYKEKGFLRKLLRI